MAAGKFPHNFLLVVLRDLLDNIKTDFSNNQNKTQVNDPGHLGGAPFGTKSNRLTSSSTVSTVCRNPYWPNFGPIVSQNGLIAEEVHSVVDLLFDSPTNI
jgi:hypothetical protein